MFDKSVWPEEDLRRLWIALVKVLTNHRGPLMGAQRAVRFKEILCFTLLRFSSPCVFLAQLILSILCLNRKSYCHVKSTNQLSILCDSPRQIQA